MDAKLNQFHELLQMMVLAAWLDRAGVDRIAEKLSMAYLAEILRVL